MGGEPIQCMVTGFRRLKAFASRFSPEAQFEEQTSSEAAEILFYIFGKMLGEVTG